jgi:hypothetical protein
MAEVQARIAASHRLTEDLIRILNHDLPPSRLATPSLVLPAFLAALKCERGKRFSILKEAAELVRTDRRRRYRRGPADAEAIGTGPFDHRVSVPTTDAS